MKNRLLGFGIAVAVILAVALTACGDLGDDARIVINQDEEEGTPIADFQLMGWYWEKQTNDEFSFTYNFKNDGTVSVTHCCGEEFHCNFSWFLDGNVLFTYGSEMGSPEAEAGTITLTEKDGIVKLIRKDGTVFIRGEQADPEPYFRATSLKPRKPLGTWRGNNAEFIFSDNDVLQINSLSEGGGALRSGQYRYLAKYVGNDNGVPRNYLAIWGPFADGEKADVWLYRYGSFSQSSSTLPLTSLNGDGINYNLTRVVQ